MDLWITVGIIGLILGGMLLGAAITKLWITTLRARRAACCFKSSPTLLWAAFLTLLALESDSLGAPSIQSERVGGLLCVSLKMKRDAGFARFEFVGADRAQCLRRNIIHARGAAGVLHRQRLFSYFVPFSA